MSRRRSAQGVLRWRTVALLGVLALLLLWRDPMVLSRAWGNAGQVVLTRALVGAPDGPNIQDVGQAEALLRKAVSWDADNPGAHQALGWALAAQGREEEAVAEWRAGGFALEDFIARGDEARTARDYAEAIVWYERAGRLEPDLGDPWYYMGLAYEGLNRWEDALEAYDQAYEAAVFATVRKSSPRYLMGIIYQWRLNSPQTDAALAAYDVAIGLDDFSTDQEAADCHYKRGEVLRWSGSEPGVYIAECQLALELDPNHVGAHILLGVGQYYGHGDLVNAEAEIRRALELAPENEWAYYHLGEMYRLEGRADDARRMFEQALDINPEFGTAQKRLQLLNDEG